MTGVELQKISQIFIYSIGDGSDNPFFMEALHEIAEEPSEVKLQQLANSRRVNDAFWDEIERHINHCHIVDKEMFEHGVALLENW